MERILLRLEEELGGFEKDELPRLNGRLETARLRLRVSGWLPFESRHRRLCWLEGLQLIASLFCMMHEKSG